MMTRFISKEYVALALIKAKSEVFMESFVTMSELNRFTLFMQQKFNEREMDTIISCELTPEYFNIMDGVVTTTDRCCLSLDILPNDIMNFLTDKLLILEFFMQMETERFSTLQSFSQIIIGNQLEASKKIAKKREPLD